ncbi:MAG TPA: hypothetical protein P5268_06120 [Candidatus Marinimicrobia bacterium]|nr:hypothetical protein [Candidatus Neomarinimicrobiota bacterium]HRS51081.1 hypothetical protein [Candidatus Neomarinimicrobiota bacterium]HRU92587.1 hypothetical protein [Candidatus Neomarinimicrobiota bacterium]
MPQNKIIIALIILSLATVSGFSQSPKAVRVLVDTVLVFDGNTSLAEAKNKTLAFARRSRQQSTFSQFRLKRATL